MEMEHFMNKLELDGRWRILKGRMVQTMGLLTRNAARRARGQREELIGRIQKRSGEICRATKRFVRETHHREKTRELFSGRKMTI